MKNTRHSAAYGRDQIGECSPLLVRRGGRDIKKISAQPTLLERPGWSLTTRFRCERPPRLRGPRWLRIFFLIAQPPLLTRRGLLSPKNLLKKTKSAICY